MVQGLFSFFLFYCGSSINQYAGQRTLKDVFWASLLLLELTYFKTIVLPNHFRMLHVFMEKQHFIRRTISLVFCSSSFSILKKKLKGHQLIVSSSPIQFLVILLKESDLNFPIIWGLGGYL